MYELEACRINIATVECSSPTYVTTCYRDYRLHVHQEFLKANAMRNAISSSTSQFYETIHICQNYTVLVYRGSL